MVKRVPIYIVVAVKWNDDCGMVEMAESGRVCCVLGDEVKYSDMTCWSYLVCCTGFMRCGVE